MKWLFGWGLFLVAGALIIWVISGVVNAYINAKVATAGGGGVGITLPDGTSITGILSL